MSQARSEIAGNVIFLSTISLLPLRVTENEADSTSETVFKEEIKGLIAYCRSSLEDEIYTEVFFVLDERGLKFRPSHVGSSPVSVSGHNHVESRAKAAKSGLPCPHPSFQPLLLLCFKRAAEMRFLFIKNHFTFL